MKRVNRNDPCPCGSGLKYKKCCLKKQEVTASLFKKFDALYASIKQCNNDLLDKANIPYYVGATFYDAINLTITSNALSLLKGFFQNNHYSITNSLNMRNIIECFTLLEMDKKGDISDKQKLLFVEQYKLIEYVSYDKSDGRYGDILHLNDLRNSYNSAKNIFIQELNSERRFKKIIASRLPFLCDETINFNSLIKKYCEWYLQAYIYLSRMIHPSSYMNIRDDKYHDKLTSIILLQLINAFGSYPVTNATTYTEEQNIVYVFGMKLSNNYGQRLYDIQKGEWEILKKLSLKLTELFGGENYMCNFIQELTLVMHDINTDSELGYTENVKLKFKVIAEMFACFNETYFNSPSYSSPDYYYYMMTIYDTIKDYEERGESYPNDLTEKAYNKFKECFTCATIDKEAFILSFLKPLGFLMNKEGDYPTYTKLVCDYFDKTVPDDVMMAERMDDGSIRESQVSLRDYFKLLYKESNNMSHGCGYLFFANSGAWMDDVSIINYVDQTIVKLLMKIGLYFAADESKCGITLSELIKTAINQMVILIEEKSKILSINRIKKSF